MEGTGWRPEDEAGQVRPGCPRLCRSGNSRTKEKVGLGERRWFCHLICLLSCRILSKLSQEINKNEERRSIFTRK